LQLLTGKPRAHHVSNNYFFPSKLVFGLDVRLPPVFQAPFPSAPPPGLQSVRESLHLRTTKIDRYRRKRSRSFRRINHASVPWGIYTHRLFTKTCARTGLSSIQPIAQPRHKATKKKVQSRLSLSCSSCTPKEQMCTFRLVLWQHACASTSFVVHPAGAAPARVKCRVSTPSETCTLAGSKSLRACGNPLQDIRKECVPSTTYVGIPILPNNVGGSTPTLTIQPSSSDCNRTNQSHPSIPY
jgi:hypothetical protein